MTHALELAGGLDRVRLLAIASGGGHWIELQRIRPAFQGFDVAFASVYPEYASDVPGCRYYTFRDVSRFERIGFLILPFQLLRIILRERPKIIVTTGSLPACLAIILAKFLLRSKAVWIDSVANVEELSSSGKLAGKFSDAWLTQWPQVSRKTGAEYWGAVL